MSEFGAEYPASKILSALESDDLVPAILFRTSRRQCDEDMEKLEHHRGFELPREHQRRIKEEVFALIKKYDVDATVVLDHPQYDTLVKTGAGAHHAGQLLIWRLLLEELMSRGVMRMMIATGTVAAGVDFPARSVVITAHSKRGSEGFNVLSSAEFQQMAGRAGRRGKDTVGFCLVAPGRFADARVIRDVSHRPPEPLRSAYYAAPSTVLNLLKFRTVEDLKYTVSKSLAAFLDRKSGNILRDEAKLMEAENEANPALKGESLKKAIKRVRRKVHEAETLEQRQSTQLAEALAGLTRLGYIENDALTVKGQWAAELCTSLVLELGEAISSGILYDVGMNELVGLVASIAGDAHRNYFGLRPNPIKKEYFRKMAELLTYVQQSYPRSFANDIEVQPEAAITVITWMESESWAEFSGLLRLAGAAEGDVARLVTQTADHLNQIAKLKDAHPELARMAWEGRKLLLKPPLSEAYLSD